MPTLSEGKKVKIPELELIDDPSLARVYSNFVSVATGPYECNITFCHIDPTSKSAKPEAKVVAKVMIPLSLVKRTLEVIESNYNNTMKKLEKLQKK